MGGTKIEDAITLIGEDAINRIMADVRANTIDRQRMKDIAWGLPAKPGEKRIGGNHLKRMENGNRLPDEEEMRHILSDWVEFGEIPQDRVLALDVLINVFKKDHIALKPLAKDLEEDVREGKGKNRMKLLSVRTRDEEIDEAVPLLFSAISSFSVHSLQTNGDSGHCTSVEEPDQPSTSTVVVGLELREMDTQAHSEHPQGQQRSEMSGDYHLGEIGDRRNTSETDPHREQPTESSQLSSSQSSHSIKSEGCSEKVKSWLGSKTLRKTICMTMGLVIVFACGFAANPSNYSSSRGSQNFTSPGLVTNITSSTPWQTLPPPLNLIGYVHLVVPGGILLGGGTDGYDHNGTQVWFWDNKSQVWTDLPSFHVKRINACSKIEGSKVTVWGGIQGAEPEKPDCHLSTEVFDFEQPHLEWILIKHDTIDESLCKVFICDEYDNQL